MLHRYARRRMILEGIDWKEVASVTGYVIGAGATGYMSFKKLYNPNGITWRRAIKGNADIKPMLQKLAYKHEHACRVALCYLENGGGLPYVGAQLYSSILVDVTNDETKEYVDRWQKVRVDTSFLRILQMVSVNGIHRIPSTENMPDGAVKDAALAEGITAFDIHFIRATKKKWFYLIVSHCEDTFETPEYKVDVRVLIDQLTNMIK